MGPEPRAPLGKEDVGLPHNTRQAPCRQPPAWSAVHRSTPPLARGPPCRAQRQLKGGVQPDLHTQDWSAYVCQDTGPVGHAQRDRFIVRS